MIKNTLNYPDERFRLVYKYARQWIVKTFGFKLFCVLFINKYDKHFKTEIFKSRQGK